jgi:hypothetical protein
VFFVFFVSFVLLFTAQPRYGIDGGGTARRQVAGDQRHAHQDSGRGGEAGGISCGDAADAGC